MKEKVGKVLMLIGITVSLLGFVLYILEQYEEDEEVIQIKELIKEADKIIKQSKG